MHKTRLLSYNPFFVYPFLLWVVAGGWLLAHYSAKDLFCAVNSNYTTSADAVMSYATWMGQGVVITVALASLFLIPRFRNVWYFVFALLCNILPFFAQQGLKSYFDSPRPINFFQHAAWIHLPPGCPELLYRSYPSGHSEGAFCFFCFLSLLLPARWRPFGLVFFMLALAVCYSRLYLAAHFFADVYAGSIVGTVLCLFLYAVIDNVKARFFMKKDTFNA